MEALYQSNLLFAVSVAIAAGVSGFVYVTVLTQPGQILAGWKTFLENTYIKITGWETDRYFRYRWVMKPIVECELCVSGQLALWLFLVPALLKVFSLIFCICLSILIAKLLSNQQPR